MNVESKKYNSGDHKFSSTNENPMILKNIHKNQNKNQSSKSPLPKFLNWLKRKIHSGDENFALGSQNLILYKPFKGHSNLIFILPEVFDQYYRFSGISPTLIQSELKQALMINFSYTFVRNQKIIEVFPCQLITK